MHPDTTSKIKSHWTEEEDNFIRNNYTTMDDATLAKSLNVSIYSVKHRRLKLNALKAPLGVPWSKREDDFIKTNYKTMTDAVIGEHLGRTPLAVKHRRLKLGETHGVLSKKWSQEEIDFILENADIMSKKEIAKKLRRTEGAVKKKMLEILGTSNFSEIAGYYTTPQIAKLIGNTNGKILYWIKNKKMPSKKIKINESNLKQPFIYAINLYDFYKWLKKNHQNLEIDFTKCDLSAVHYTPSWFRSEFAKQSKYGKQRNWSLNEEALLWNYKTKTSLSNKEIAEKLGRTEGSINKKVYYLQKKIKDDKGYLKKIENCKVCIF